MSVIVCRGRSGVGSARIERDCAVGSVDGPWTVCGLWAVGCLVVFNAAQSKSSAVQCSVVQRRAGTVHLAGVEYAPPRSLRKVTGASSRARTGKQSRVEQGSWPGLSRDVRLVLIKALSWSLVPFQVPFWASLGPTVSGAAGERAQVGLDAQPGRPSG